MFVAHLAIGPAGLDQAGLQASFSLAEADEHSGTLNPQCEMRKRGVPLQQRRRGRAGPWDRLTDPMTALLSGTVVRETVARGEGRAVEAVAEVEEPG
jgi:hypothetical protein